MTNDFASSPRQRIMWQRSLILGLFSLGIGIPLFWYYFAFTGSKNLCDLTSAPTQSAYCQFTGVKTLSHFSASRSLLISPDGKLVSDTGDGKSIAIWNLATGQPLTQLQGTPQAIRSIAMSPDTQTIVSGGMDGSIRLWNLQTGKLSRTLVEPTTPSNSLNQVTAVAISADGKTLVSSGLDRSIKIWDLTTGEVKLTMPGHAGGTESLVITPDGKTVISGGGDKQIHLNELATGRLLGSLEGHRQPVRSLSITPDGTTLVSTSWKQIKVWDLATRQPKVSTGSYPITDAVITADGAHVLASGGEGMIKVWNAQTGSLEAILPGVDSSIWTSAVAISPDSQTVFSITGNSTVEVWRRNVAEDQAVIHR